ncbi:uncharacterized protein LOC126906939 [Daktulosphaira vitifoliae]|uniref:uncharacterized protein LOC126906939 n=1 Tax=Daktulosphaira vitifoliae TaxID=58002 RepID=UPI0021AA4D0B|nr:uncharacterized protein LOC126906939 [Daktulosphaira vitifoliae]
MNITIYTFVLFINICYSLDMKNLSYDEVNEYRKQNSNLMELIILPNTIYTDPDTVQVIDEHLFYNNDDIDVVDKSKPYRGTAPVGFYVTEVIGKSLGQVLKETIDEREDLFEGMVWIRNVIESIGISAMYRFCVISSKIATPIASRRIVFLLAQSKKFLYFLKGKFMKYQLRIEPIDELLSYIDDVINAGKVNFSVKYKYIESCGNFMNRYSKCINLVKLFDYSSIYNIDHGTSLRNELFFTLSFTNYRLCNFLQDKAVEECKLKLCKNSIVMVFLNY